MTFNPYAQQPTKFRESLTFQEILNHQIEKCLEALADDESRIWVSQILSLQNLIVPSMLDNEYSSDLEKLEANWKLDLAKRDKEFEREKRLARGGAPDLVEHEGKVPGKDYWRAKFQIILSLCDRKDLLLKNAKESEI